MNRKLFSGSMDGFGNAPSAVVEEDGEEQGEAVPISAVNVGGRRC